MFGARVKKLREAQKLSMEKLAAKAGVGKATIYRVEAEKFDPTLSTLRGIAKGLGITVGELVDDEPVKGGDLDEQARAT